MRNRVTTLVLAAAIAFAAAVAGHAQTPMSVKLGLWEITSTSQMAGMPAMPQIDLSQVPPEQRARVEAMMKQGPLGGQPMITKTCVTKEKLEKQFFNPRQSDDSCKQTLVSSTASMQEMKVECTGEHKMNGTVKFQAVDDEHVKGAVHFDAEGQGHAMTVDSAIAGKWVAADCGDVK